jgi:hypothetical protein
MIIRPPAQNVESFLNAIAKHLTSRPWDVDKSDDGSVTFGLSGWRGEFECQDIDGLKTPIGLRLISDDGEVRYDDVSVVEEAISLLEGLEYKDDSEDPEPKAAVRPYHPGDESEDEDETERRPRRNH